MYCKKCGSQTDDGARFCHVCGNRLTADTEKAKKHLGTREIVILAAAVLVGAALLDGMLFALGRSFPKEPITLAEMTETAAQTEPEQEPVLDLPGVPVVEPLDWDNVAEAPAASFRYEEGARGEGVIILEYIGSDPIVKIPIEIGGQPVMAVSGEAFRGNTLITHVYFPDTVPLGTADPRVLGKFEEVEADAMFEDCTSLRQVRLVKYFLPHDIFRNCTSLELVSFSENAEGSGRIESNAFEGCTSLTRFDASIHFDTIWDWAFKGCSSLAGIWLPEVTRISQGTFKGCTSLKTVIAPMVDNIEGSSFAGCANLTDLEICKGYNGEMDGGIHPSAFVGCSSLEAVRFAESDVRYPYEFSCDDHALYTIVGEEVALAAFLDTCETVNPPLRQDMTKVGGNVFQFAKVRVVTFPASVTQVGGFYDSTTIEEVYLSPGTKLKGCSDEMFNYTPSIRIIDFSNDEGGVYYEFSIWNVHLPNLEKVIYPKR